MKKKLLILTSALAALGIAIGSLLSGSFKLNKIFASDKPASMECSYYFNDSNGYTSLYELNKTRLSNGSDLTEVTTWGTVTSTFYNGAVAQQFIQSTDKNGKVGATCLYSINDGEVFPVGSVVSVTGTMTIYNGMSEMKNFTVTKDYNENPSPVITRELESTIFTSSATTDEIQEAKRNGTIRVHLSDLTLGNVTSSRQCIATFENGDTCLLFFNSISNKTQIINKINTAIANESKVNVSGYLTYYTGSSAFQVLLRDPDDIVEIESDKDVSYIELSTDKMFYYKGTASKSDFTVTIHYTDGSTQTTSSFEFVNAVDTNTVGNQTVRVSFTKGGLTFYDEILVTVYDRIYEIEPVDPVRAYYIGESFIKPEIRGYSSTDYIDVTDDVTDITGFDSSYQHSADISLAYVNAYGQTISRTYEYSASSVIDMNYAGLQVNYEYGESFVRPTMYAEFALGSGEYDVSDRVEYSGYDPYQEGEQTITYTFGNYEDTFTVTVASGKTLSYIQLSNKKTEYYVDDPFVMPTVTAYYDDYSYEDVTAYATMDGFDSSSIGVCLVSISYGGMSDSYWVSINMRDDYEILNVSISGIGSYNTGNYGASNGFEYYRAVKSSGNLLRLLALNSLTGVPTLSGSLYNTNPIDDIDTINITYYTDSSSGDRAPRLYFGEHNYFDDTYVALDYSTSSKESSISLTTEDVNYFLIDGGDSGMTIESITVYYTDTSTTTGDTYTVSGANVNSYRIAPTQYSGSLVAGSSYVDVPTSINTSTGAVLATKRYTYYPYSYVEEHPSLASSACYTDPVDVCNYVQAFGCAPANYGSNSSIKMADNEYVPSLSDINYTFGSSARCISKYSRTDGYATVVPYYGYTPLYYELDIDTNGSYTTSSRQVGRIVYWSTGFDVSNYGYGSQGVCTYTDDHYATFAEYNNYGGFMPRFNAERKITAKAWSEPTTIVVS